MKHRDAREDIDIRAEVPVPLHRGFYRLLFQSCRKDREHEWLRFIKTSRGFFEICHLRQQCPPYFNRGCVWYWLSWPSWAASASSSSLSQAAAAAAAAAKRSKQPNANMLGFSNLGGLRMWGADFRASCLCSSVRILLLPSLDVEGL